MAGRHRRRQRVDDLERRSSDGGEGIGQTIWIDATEPRNLESADDAPLGVKRVPGFRSMKSAVEWIEREYPELSENDYNVIRSVVGHRTRPGAKINIVDFCPKYSPEETAKRLQENIDRAAEHEEASK